MIPDVITIDFETEPILSRPQYPPEPVGVSIKWPGQRSIYWAWGHPSGNNCEPSAAYSELERVWKTGLPLLFHNAAFDLSVAYEKLGLPRLPWFRVHETQFLLFLFDPHAGNFQLKPSAERILGMAPDEQDAVADWVWENRKALVVMYGGKVTRAKSVEGSSGWWTSKVPAHIVGPYAEGDTDRTLALFQYLYPRIAAAGMMPAYDRERRLMPILMENERIGLRVDKKPLLRDLDTYHNALNLVEVAMRHYLNAPDLSFDNDRDIARAFLKANIIKPDSWVTTKTGQLSVAKDNLPPDSFVNPEFASAFGYRNRLITCLRMFMEPWAEAQGDYIYTRWNQVLSARGGTRTGRPSMSKPNLLNVSKSWDDRDDGYVHPHRLGVPELPLVRKYILPDPGHLFVHRDFDGQELRVFAHYESGELLRMYLDNPDLDPHGWVKERIAVLTGRIMGRTPVKIMNFQSLYGGGIQAITEKLRCSRKEAYEFKSFHDQALPGRKIMSEEILRLVRRGEPVRTWGGRVYYVEEPSRKNGRTQTWEYKLINYVIQGSAADITKEAICRWYEGGGAYNGTRFLLTVYDEINLSAPKPVVRESMEFLREVMNGMELDCPMRSSGKIGESWGTLTKE